MPSLRVPVSWLREYVTVDASADQIAERLHMAGMEVDRVERSGGAWGDKVHVGRITKLEKHPNADKLLLATVDYGSGRIKTVVTGAPNLAVGDIVPYAEAGASLIDGHTGKPMVLKPKPMRGVESEGERGQRPAQLVLGPRDQLEQQPQPHHDDGQAARDEPPHVDHPIREEPIADAAHAAHVAPLAARELLAQPARVGIDRP